MAMTVKECCCGRALDGCKYHDPKLNPTSTSSKMAKVKPMGSTAPAFDCRWTSGTHVVVGEVWGEYECIAAGTTGSRLASIYERISDGGVAGVGAYKVGDLLDGSAIWRKKV